MISTDPAGGSSAWKPFAATDNDRALLDVSCIGKSLCVAVDHKGHAVIGTDATRAG